MGKFRDQMYKKMVMKNFSQNTIESYLSQMQSYVKRYNKSPDCMAEKEIIDYLYYLKKQQGYSYATINVAYCSIKFFYQCVLGKNLNFKIIPFPKSPKRLPFVLSTNEVLALFKVTENLKHKVILMTTYSSGLRISEVARLKIKDIDSNRMQIRVEQGKGKKDRYTLLSNLLILYLRKYYKEYRPKYWLFPGQDENKPLSRMAINRVFTKAKKKLV